MSYTKFEKQNGQALVEVLIGMALFALISSSVSFLVIDSYSLEKQSSDIEQATAFANEGFEAVKSIKENNWAEILDSVDGATHGLDDSSGNWQISGSDNVVEKFTRTLQFLDVYRGADGRGDILDSSDPSAVPDIHTKEVVISVSWNEPRASDLELRQYISNWDSVDWVQTNWSGGNGQSIWSDDSRFDIDDGNIDFSTSGEIKLAETGGGSCDGYTWNFDTPGDYIYDSGKIEVTGGMAQLISQGGTQGGQTSDSGFDSGGSWSSGSWDQNGSDYVFNNRIGFLGNPSWWVYSYIRGRNNAQVGGYWEQPFTTSVDNPDSVSISLDYQPWYRAGFGSGDIAWFYVFIESSSGAPSSISEAVWAQEITAGDSFQTWSTGVSIDATSKVGAADTYYLKLALRLDTANAPGNPYRTVLAGYDNVQLEWNKTTSQYPNDNPEINPAVSYQPTEVAVWTEFSEAANKEGGEIYYQVSDDDGATWYYWDSTSWNNAGSSDYNTADVVNDNLWSFDTSSGKFMFKAFLESDGSQFIQLDSVNLDCETMQMESGKVNTDENWESVSFVNTYHSPIIVGSYFESNNNLPASVRLRNITGKDFEVRLQHPSEANLSIDEITYFAIEEGVWEEQGFKMEAHKYDTNTVGNAWTGWTGWNSDTQTYDHTFSTDPIVLHQVMTNNDSDWITTYVSDINSKSSPPDTDGVAIALNGAEVTSNHGDETIGWIALERDRSVSFDGTDFETSRTSDSVRGHGTCSNFGYQNDYDSSPLVLGFLQEMDGGNGGWTVTCNNSTTQAGFHVEEDQENDSERNHTTETVAYIVFEDSIVYSGGGNTSGYKLEGTLTSSAFDSAKVSNFQIIEWNEVLPTCTPACEVRVQLRSAPDSGGSPGAWTGWYGESGNGSYFSNYLGNKIPGDIRTNRWIQYRVTLIGDGSGTPILEEIRLNYDT